MITLPNRQCPIHDQPQHLKKCHGFRDKTIEDRKAFLKEQGICFRCCASTTHLARNYKTPGYSPLDVKCPYPFLKSWREGGRRHIFNCTEVCGESLSARSCSKICLVKVHPKGYPGKTTRVYAILDDQSNRSLAKSEFFDIFNIKGSVSPNTLRTCAGVTETAGKRATGYLVEFVDGKTSLTFPTIIECNQMQDDRTYSYPQSCTPSTHLRSVADQIPALDSDTQILFLLGRDILRVHKVHEHHNGPHNAPDTRRLDLGWVLLSDVCLGNAHKPVTVNTFSMSVFENVRTSLFSPCPNHILVKEKFSCKG